MTETSLVRSGVPELAIRIRALAGVAAYLTYVVPPAEAPRVLSELARELVSVDPALTATVVVHASAVESVARVGGAPEGAVVLVDATAYQEDDWELLDRRRSALARNAPVVFVTGRASLERLMRVAPNLASWLGGLAFAWEDVAGPTDEQRSQRLDALRTWAGMSDEDVVRAAEVRTLPRDPEFAEWLVLLGRGDLLDER